MGFSFNCSGLGGKDKWEAAEADQYTGAIEDLIGPIIRFYFESDEKRKVVYLYDH